MAETFKVPIQLALLAAAGFFAWWVGNYILPLNDAIKEHETVIRRLERENATIIEARKGDRRDIDRMQSEINALNNRARNGNSPPSY